MNQYKKTVFLWVLLLTICATSFVGCINSTDGDFYPYLPFTTTETTHVSETTTPEETTLEMTTPEVTTSEVTTPEVTTPEETTPEETTPEETTPEETTPEATTPEETTPEETTPEETSPEETIPEQPSNGKIKIYIDQGHNPHSWNTGATGNGLNEADLTFEIGMLLYELLLQDERFEVRLSRPTADTILGTDNESAKAARVEDAAAWGADYFISLHINSFTTSSVTGLEVYSASGDQEGYDLGKDILTGLVQSVELRNRGIKDGSDLYVLKNATMPAVLVEMGFISNEGDAALLDNEPERFAQGVYNGILSYFDSKEETEQPYVQSLLKQILSAAKAMPLCLIATPIILQKSKRKKF